MLDPKEIDNFFNASAIRKKFDADKIAKRTRWVMLTKISLPGLAAILAITLLIIPTLKKDIKDFGIDLIAGKGDIEQLNIEKTTIYVTDTKNRVNNFVAHQVKETSAGSQAYILSFPEAIIPFANNEWINIKSPSGTYNQQTSLLRLQNSVEVFYSKGMTLYAKEVFFDFKKSLGYSHHPVTGSGFIGEVNSEGFEFSGKTNILTLLGKTHIVINEESLRND